MAFGHIMVLNTSFRVVFRSIWLQIKCSKKLELNNATTDRSIDIIEHEPIYVEVVT